MKNTRNLKGFGRCASVQKVCSVQLVARVQTGCANTPPVRGGVWLHTTVCFGQLAAHGCTLHTRFNKQGKN